MKSILVACIILIVAEVAHAPLHKDNPTDLTIRGELTATSEGPGNHVGIQLNGSQWFTVTKSAWHKNQVVGGFLLSDKMWVSVKYNRADYHIHWGQRHYYAKTVNYGHVIQPVLALSSRGWLSEWEGR